MYLAIKHIHIFCAVLSGTGFAVRLALTLGESPLVGRRWLRIVPHVNDTILLGAAIALATMLGQYPLVNGWLTAKVVALFGYIGLGMLALKPGRGAQARLTAGLAALAVFGYIVSVAISRDPRGLLAWL